MREAAALWERISDDEGIESRDAKWSHPDLLPVLPPDDAVDGDMSTASTSDEPSAIQAADSSTQTGESTSSSSKDDGIDWDAELSKLLEESDIDDTDNENGTMVKTERMVMLHKPIPPIPIQITVPTIPATPQAIPEILTTPAETPPTPTPSIKTTPTTVPMMARAMRISSLSSRPAAPYAQIHAIPSRC
jgi:hypothetical protein